MAQLDKAPGGMTLGELSRRMMVSNGNVTGLSERLVALGLLDRRQSRSDRRAQLVSLTPEGRRVFRAMARAHEGWIAEIVSQLSPADIDLLMRLLAKTKASARVAISGEPPR
jgi:DNA-binding MarR family transcriptional regulator